MKIHLVLWFLAFYFGWNAAAPSPKPKATCGYAGCPTGREGVINVHIVPHTHDDVGWLKTVDQYYYGSSTRYQKAGVQYILDSIIRELRRDPTRRFIYVEMGFFTLWWREQSAETKAFVHQLVEEGRLEFINGGWCMNDEAAPHYSDIIDQMSWGLRFLNDTFGECGRPRVAWQIDPFGHSREQAAIFAQMNFDAQFFARLDWEDKNRRMLNKEMEMIWHASNSLGDAGSLFSGALYDHYSPPSGFCFDVLCEDSPIIDNPRLADYNVPAKIGQLLNYTRRQASRFASNHIMFTMGNDFNYMSGVMWFKNLDKMIKYVNEMAEDIHMFYSTPSCYVKALNEAGITWPTKSDDFFPYSNDPHSYWTGYFTSRPAHKGMIRQGNTVLQTCKQLHTLSGRSGMDQARIDRLRSFMAESQHHDAVAGTEKQHVAFDYALRLHSGMLDCQQDVVQSLSNMLPAGNEPLPEIKFCLQLNISQCDVSESSDRFVATVYNPKGQRVSKYVRLPVAQGTFTVVAPSGDVIPSQLVPIASAVLSVEERASTATHELVFYASDLPPLGHKTYHVTKSTNRAAPSQRTATWRPEKGQRVSIGNQRVSVNFDANGLIDGISVDGQLTPLSQNLYWYHGMKGFNTIFADRASGAYIFRPNGTDAQPISESAQLVVHTGDLVHEVHQSFSSWASQIVRLYDQADHVEIEWTVGPIPVGDGIGKEIINRVVTETASDGRFFTDSNGRQTLQRQRNYRPTWTLNVTEPVSGNYYPINSHIYVEDSSGRLAALINDRSQGGTSLYDGQIELMVHRRLLYDDAFGVGEALNEPGEGPDFPGLIARGTHLLAVRTGLTGPSMFVVRPLVRTQFTPPWLLFSPTELSAQDWNNNFVSEKSGLSQPLPDNVHLLTLEPWKNGTHLLRLEHIYDVDEDPALSQPVDIVLDDLLADFRITSAEETTLSANQWKKDAERLQWQAQTPAIRFQAAAANRLSFRPESAGSRFNVQLAPMEIKTFVITAEPRI